MYSQNGREPSIYMCKYGDESELCSALPIQATSVTAPVSENMMSPGYWHIVHIPVALARGQAAVMQCWQCRCVVVQD